jgi:phospholipid/cholesterol/gamma-HCH transport system substrate-binding protein
VKAIRKYYRPFLAIIGLMAIAVAVSGFILTNQRLRFPFISPKPIHMEVEFDNAQAVTPGQGQTVQVAGVQVGDIVDVKLHDGRALVGIDVKPEFKDVIHTDASATLRPRTGLKDMYIQIYPGSQKAKLAKAGFTVPVSKTLTDVDLDEILSSFDADTRDYLQLLVNGAGNGLKGRGQDLAEVFRRFKPTFRDLARVNKAVAVEREALKSNINSLARLNGQLAKRPQDLSRLVDASAATFRAFASENQNVSRTVHLLPGTLRQATDTLQKVRPFANALGPAARRLGPAFTALDAANKKTAPLGREAAPILRDQIRPFVRASRPLVADLKPAAQGLSATTVPLTRSFKVFNTFFNMLGYNDNGREAPGAANREEGYLFWLAWVTHQGINLINVDDANGPMRPIFLTGTCTTLQNLLKGRPELEFGLALSPLLTTVCGDPQTSSVDLPLAKKITAAGLKADKVAKP